MSVKAVSGGVSQVVIEADQQGQRIDNFLLSRLKGVPKSRIYKILRKGEVRVNKKRIKPEYRIQTGDLVRIPPVRIAEKEALPVPSDSLGQLLLDSVLYEDSDLLVLNKPSGLASHGGTGVRLGLIEAARQVWGNDSLELAHRLDKGTSGCLILVKSLQAGNAVTAQFREHKVSKTYHALADGRWAKGQTIVDAPLLRLPPRGGERKVEVSAEGKSAKTTFTLLQHYTDCSLIEARPASGRTHQIRVHAQMQGHALLGDDKYGDAARNRLWTDRGVKRLCLHARALAFQGPSGQALSIEAAYDESFRAILDRLAAQERKQRD